MTARQSEIHSRPILPSFNVAVALAVHAVCLAFVPICFSRFADQTPYLARKPTGGVVHVCVSAFVSSLSQYPCGVEDVGRTE